MSFLGFSFRAPFSILIAVAYVVGAVTGSSLFVLLRHSLRQVGQLNAIELTALHGLMLSAA